MFQSVDFDYLLVKNDHLNSKKKTRWIVRLINDLFRLRDQN